jgi:hypothetical protein
MVQPLRAALFFDNAEGFGSWRLVLSGKAIKDLREQRKGGIFRIVIKKMKCVCTMSPRLFHFEILTEKYRELSCAHFSQDNHGLLNNSAYDVPVYQAKLDRDHRLVVYNPSLSALF